MSLLFLILFLIEIIYIFTIFQYITKDKKKKKRESMTNSITNNIKKNIIQEINNEKEARLNSNLVISLITQKMSSFQISDSQAKKILFDIKHFFKNSMPEFSQKINVKNFTFDLINNKISKLSPENKMLTFTFLYLFINQDLISKEQLYLHYEQQFGHFLYFINIHDYINKSNIIYQRVPYKYSNILNIKDISNLYEGLRKNGIVPFSSLLFLKKNYQKYILRKKIYVRKRIPDTTQVPDDENYNFYHRNLEKISKLDKESIFEGILEEDNYINIIDSRNKPNNISEKKKNKKDDNQVSPLNSIYKSKKIRYDSKDKQDLFTKFIDPERDSDFYYYNQFSNYKNRPIKWKCQRQWEESEGPNFLDLKYIYPGRLNN